LIAGTAYTYQVSAVDQAGNESARSAAIQATTLTPPDTQAPNTPGNLRTVSITTDRIDLTWDASTDPSTGSGQASGVTGYRVYRDNIYMMTVAVSSYYNAGLSPGESHAYQVSAVDAAGNESGRSVSLTVITLLPPDTTAPSIPTGLTASVISTNQINLSWSASTDNVAVSGYIIFQNNVQVGTSDRNTYQATSLAAATGYTFKVRATDSAGNQSADSNQVIASTLDPADSQAPGIIIVLPTQNATYSTSSAHITLSGTAIDNIGVSRVNWANDRGGAGIAAGTNVWLIDDIELQAGVNNLSVTAHDAAGNSSSDSLTITYNPPDTQAPSAPILSGIAYTAWQINLTWTASTDSAVNGIAASGLAGYRLYRDNVLIATLTGRSYQNFGLTPATAYTYRVAAFDRAGNTVDSNHVTLTTASATDSLPPTAPASLRAYLANDRQVNLSWYRSTDPLDSARLASGIAGYRIYRDNRRVGFSAGTAYSDIDLATSTNFRYIVSAVDNAGNESFSSNTVQISTQTGLEKIRPSGPRYLRTNIISHNKARFDWPAATDNVGVTGYMIFRNGLHIASVNGTAFEEAGLAPLTVYSYRVSAFDAAGNNSYQSSALNLRTQATPDTTAPTQPANFRNVYNSYYPWTVRLYWNSSTDDRPGLRYYIYRNNQLIAESRYGAFSENLKEPGYYIYQVSAVDWAGNESARTNTIVQPYVRDDIAPTLPRNLRSVYNAYYPNQVRLYWDRSVDDRYGAIKYRVYKNGSVLTVTNGTSFAENLTVYGTNYYEVQAYDPAGNETGRSNQVSVSYAADTVAPSVPAGLRAFQDTRTTNLMKIYWNRSLDDRAGNIVYNVYRDGVKLGATRNTSYYDRLATRGTYIYSISAQDQANNESDLSATVTMVY
jgi:chitodextrinase